MSTWMSLSIYSYKLLYIITLLIIFDLKYFYKCEVRLIVNYSFFHNNNNSSSSK